MATHDYDIANQSGASFRADLNNALAAIVSQNSSATAPATTFAYQYWVDTSASPALIKQRNAANDGWITLAEVDGQLLAKDGTVSKPGISFSSDANLGLRRNSADTLSIVTGGADRVTVDSSGNLGVGVTAPSTNLHVEGSPNCTAQITCGDGGNSILNLGDTNDVDAGKILYNNFNESLSFWTNNSIRLTIDTDGKCGIGTESPDELLHVAGNIKTTGNIDIASGNIVNGSPAIGTSGFDLQNNGAHLLGRNTADGNSALKVFGGSGEFNVKGNGDCQNTNNTYTVISDVKLKENIVDATSQWDDIKGVRIRNYNLKASTGYSTHRQIGVVAQELEAVCPGLVKDSNDEDADGNVIGTTKTVLSSVLYMKAVKALQEAMDRIETLEAKVTALEAGN